MNNYTHYLSNHLSKLNDDKTRENKKDWISYNYKKFLPKDKNSKMLEIGPCFGELLEFLIVDNQYNDIRAVDLSQEVVDFCNTIKPGCAVKTNNTISFLKKNPGKFKMIFLLQVLEHIPKTDVVDFLKALRNSLCEDGGIIIEVPNISNNIVGVNFFFSDFTHEVAYTDMSLRYVLNMAGFTEINIYNLKVPIISFKRLIQAFLQKIFGVLLLIINKIYLPSQKQCLSPTIFAVVKK